MTASGKSDRGSEPILLRRQQGAVLYLTLNRPRAGNALSSALIGALQDQFDALKDDKSVHVVVLAGTGKLCTGHDLKEVQAANDPEFLRAFGRSAAAVMMQAIAALPQPVIAKVRGRGHRRRLPIGRGLRSGGGRGGRSAQFATPGVNIGLWCLTPMVALSRAIVPKHAMQMLLSGKLFDAEQAFRFGLISQIVDDEKLNSSVDELAGEIASKSSFTMALGKQGFYRQIGDGRRRSLRSRLPIVAAQHGPSGRQGRHPGLHRQAAAPVERPLRAWRRSNRRLNFSP